MDDRGNAFRLGQDMQPGLFRGSFELWKRGNWSKGDIRRDDILWIHRCSLSHLTIGDPTFAFHRGYARFRVLG